MSAFNFNHGAVFSLPLKNGLYGIFVLRSPQYFRPLLYAYRWFKNYIPDLERVKKLKPLILTNEIAPKMYRKQVLSITPEEALPEKFLYLGDIPFTKYPKTEIRCLNDFDYLEQQTYLEWVLEFDKAAWKIALQEEKNKKAAKPIITYN